MSRRAAILGLGRRGEHWAGLCLGAGWDVCAFDPAVNAASAVARLPGLRRVETISMAARRAELILCCVPDRLELIQMVVQRAQAEADEGSVVAVVSGAHDIDALQSCSIRPGQVVRLAPSDDGGIALDVTSRNAPDLKDAAGALMAELAALQSLQPGDFSSDHEASAESA